MKPENLPWQAEFNCTIKRADGASCDMWVIAWGDNPELVVSLGVPVGRVDIVDFIVSRCKRGQ